MRKVKVRILLGPLKFSGLYVNWLDEKDFGDIVKLVITAHF